MRSRTAPWFIGTALVALMIVGGAWLLGISPLLESAAEQRELAESEQSRIEQLEIQLSGLRADFENLDEFEAELAALLVEIPAEDGLADLTRRLNTLADEEDVVITALNPASAILVVPPTPVESAVVDDSADETSEEDDTESTADTTAETDSSGSDATATGALYAIPIEIVTLGGYEASLNFVARLQEMDVRLMLVSQMTATGQDETGAEPPRPALQDGDLELRLSTYVFVYVDPSVPTDETDPDATQPLEELPVPSSGQGNPFQRLS